LRDFFLKKYAERYHSSEDKVTLKEQTVKPKFDKDAIETLRSLGYLQ